MTSNHEVFKEFFPLCASLLHKSDDVTLEKFTKLLRASTQKTLVSLEDHLLFPLQNYLRNPKLRNENTTLQVLQVLLELLTLLPILKSSFNFHDLYISVSSLPLKLSKDIQMKVLTALLSKIPKDPEVKENLGNKVSVSIQMALKYLQNEENSVTLSSLDFLNQILQESSLDVDPYLPGILSQLLQSLRTNSLLRSRARKTILQLWRLFFLNKFLPSLKSQKPLESKTNSILLNHLFFISSIGVHEEYSEEIERLFVSLQNYNEVFLPGNFQLALLVKENLRHEFISGLSSKQLNDIVDLCQKDLFSLLQKAFWSLQDTKHSMQLIAFLVDLESIQIYSFFSYSETYKDLLLSKIKALSLLERSKAIGDESLLLQICERLSGLEVFDSLLSNLLESPSSSSFLVLSLLLSSVKGQRPENLEMVSERLLTLKDSPETANELIQLMGVIGASLQEPLQSLYLPEFLLFAFNSSYLNDSQLESFLQSVSSKTPLETIIQRYIRPLSQSLTFQLRVLYQRDQPSHSHKLLHLLLECKSFDSESLQDLLFSLLSSLNVTWMEANSFATSHILKILYLSVSYIPNLEKPQKYTKRINEIESKRQSLEEKGALTDFISSLLEDRKCNQSQLFWSTNTEEEKEFISQKFENTILFAKSVNEKETKDEENKKEISPTSYPQSFIKETLSQTRHFLSMVFVPDWQILSCNIIALCLEKSSLAQDELLPLIHLIWQPLKSTFSSCENITLLLTSLSVLKILLRVSGDFIRERVLKEAFPALLTQISKIKTFEFSQTNSRQLRLSSVLTESLVDLLESLQLDEMEVESVLEELTLFSFEPFRLVVSDALVLKKYHQEKG